MLYNKVAIFIYYNSGMGNDWKENSPSSYEAQIWNSKYKDQLKDLEQDSTLHALQNEVTSNIEATPQWEEIHIRINEIDTVVNYDAQKLQKDYIRIPFMVWPNTQSPSSLFSSPLNFSIPKSFFKQLPADLNTDFYLSRTLSPEERENFDLLIIKLYAGYKEFFVNSKSTPAEAGIKKSATIENESSSNSTLQVEEFIEDPYPISPNTEVAAQEAVTEPKLTSWEIGQRYFGAQFNLPSQNYLTISDGISKEVSINNLLVPGYKVIKIKTAQGEEMKARRNGTSYIALGGERKGLVPIIQNGDSFKNISDSHEIIVKPVTALKMSEKKTYCFLFATQYTISDLIANDQGAILVDYANTSKSSSWAHEGLWDSKEWTYIDTTTHKRILVYDGVQISKAHTSDDRIPSKESDKLQDVWKNNTEQEKRKPIDIVSPLPQKEGKVTPLPVDIKKERIDKVWDSFSPDQRPDYTIAWELTRNIFCEGLHNVESNIKWDTYGYSAVNNNTWALGRYQFVPKRHPDLFKISWVKNKEEFLAYPSAQEKYMDHRISDLENHAKNIERTARKKAEKYSHAEILALCHYLGAGWAKHYIKTGEMLPDQRKNNMDVSNYLKTVNSGIAAATSKSSINNSLASR